MNLREKSWLLDAERPTPPPARAALEGLSPSTLMEIPSATRLLGLSPDARPGAALSLARWESALLAPARRFFSAPGKALRGEVVKLGWLLAMASQEAAEGQNTGSREAGSRACPAALPTLIELVHGGSLIIDDIEDDSETRRGQPCVHKQIGLARALNLGNWLYFVSASMIEEAAEDQAAQARLYQRFNQVMLRCHQGQALDLSFQVNDLDRAELAPLAASCARLKTGALVGLAMELGALTLGAPRALGAALYTFGEEIGVALQMYDDLSGVLNPARWHKGCEDFARARPTWVWAWLAGDERVDDQRFAALRGELNQLADRERSLRALTGDPVWFSAAGALRLRCAEHLGERAGELERRLDGALASLNEALCRALPATAPATLTRGAHQLIERLKVSYL